MGLCFVSLLAAKYLVIPLQKGIHFANGFKIVDEKISE
jgi:hypothetical protein